MNQTINLENSINLSFHQGNILYVLIISIKLTLFRSILLLFLYLYRFMLLD